MALRLLLLLTFILSAPAYAQKPSEFSENKLRAYNVKYAEVVRVRDTEDTILVEAIRFDENQEILEMVKCEDTELFTEKRTFTYHRKNNLLDILVKNEIVVKKPNMVYESDQTTYSVMENQFENGRLIQLRQFLWDTTKSKVSRKEIYSYNPIDSLSGILSIIYRPEGNDSSVFYTYLDYNELGMLCKVSSVAKGRNDTSFTMCSYDEMRRLTRKENRFSFGSSDTTFYTYFKNTKLVSEKLYTNKYASFKYVYKYKKGKLVYKEEYKNGQLKFQSRYLYYKSGLLKEELNPYSKSKLLYRYQFYQ